MSGKPSAPTAQENTYSSQRKAKHRERDCSSASTKYTAFSPHRPAQSFRYSTARQSRERGTNSQEWKSCRRADASSDFASRFSGRWKIRAASSVNTSESRNSHFSRGGTETLGRKRQTSGAASTYRNESTNDGKMFLNSTFTPDQTERNQTLHFSTNQRGTTFRSFTTISRRPMQSSAQ